MTSTFLQVSWIVWKFILVCTVLISSLVGPSKSACEFDAIFNFGDSNSDTGGFNAAFPAQGSPFGMTYFKKPVGRSSDGRLIVDFLGKTYMDQFSSFFFFFLYKKIIFCFKILVSIII